MSPNGTLFAYSTPVDIKELRDHAALISMAWKDYDGERKRRMVTNTESDTSSVSSAASKAPIETLTVEFDTNNLIVRAVQPNLLLVLVGGVPPGRHTTFKITPESQGDPRYPEERIVTPIETSHDHEDILASADEATPKANESIQQFGSSHSGSQMSQLEKDMKVGLLHIQRKKLDAMTKFLRDDFASKGFVMPDDLSFP
jgi:hypothetical protein